ncbi:MAG TPA: NAD(P)H-dependent oxidoreductase, partial [Thermomicrobiales bacterium]|nr:NAD(P)H-dependent oxidoreductase [Thermomicrobiales bacterium]
EIVLGSTRVSRFGTTVLDWFEARARLEPAWEVGVIDLATLDIPWDFSSNADVALLTERITQADAVVVITPEYNHSFPGALKAAIDIIPKTAWEAKPVGFISYGGLSGGLRAVEGLRLVFAEIHATTIRDTVSFHGTSASFDAAGQPVQAELVNAAAHQLLGQLEWWAAALRNAKAVRPYQQLIPAPAPA